MPHANGGKPAERTLVPFHKDELLALFNLAGFGAARLLGDLKSEMMVSTSAHQALLHLGEERWNALIDRMDKHIDAAWPDANIQTTYRRNKE